MPQQTVASPVQTGVAALSGGAIGPVVVWFCQVVHLNPPPEAVAATIGALMVMGVHWLVNRFPPQPAQPAPATTETKQ